MYHSGLPCSSARVSVPREGGCTRIKLGQWTAFFKLYRKDGKLILVWTGVERTTESSAPQRPAAHANMRETPNPRTTSPAPSGSDSPRCSHSTLLSHRIYCPTCEQSISFRDLAVLDRTATATSLPDTSGT